MSENVPLIIQRSIDELAPKVGVDKPQLNSEFLAYLADVKIKKPSLDEAKQMEMAFISLKGGYRRKLGSIPSKAIFFKGVFLGATDLVDFNEIARNRAIKIFKSDPQRAQNEGWTDEHGTPLDRRTEVFNRPNKKFGFPLEGHSYQRTWYGIGSELEYLSWKFFSFRWYGVEVPPPPKFKIPVKFQGIRKKEDATSLLLNASRSVSSKFEELVLPDFNIEAAIRQVAPLVPFSQLSTWHEDHKKDKTAVVMVEGDVDNLWLEPHPQTGSRKIILRDSSLDSDMTEGVNVYIPDWVEIDFGEDSRIFVLGRTSMSRKTETRPEERLQINAFGIFPLPDWVTTPEQRNIGNQQTLELEWVEK